MELPPGTRSTVDQIDVNLSLSHKNWHSSHGHKVRPKLTKIQLEQLTECFSLMDADGSGAIDADELGAALKLLGINIRPSEVAALVSEVDPRNTGEVDMNGFLLIMTTTLSRLSEESSASSIPFSLVSTAYRRKRMMEGLLTGDKEVKNQLLQIAEKKDHQTTAIQLIEGQMARPEASSTPDSHELKLKASVFGKHRLEKISHMGIDEGAVASLAPDEQWACIEALQSAQDSPPSPSPSPSRLPPLASALKGSSSPTPLSPNPSSKSVGKQSRLFGKEEPPLIMKLKFERSHLVKIPSYAMDKAGRGNKTPSDHPTSRSPSSLSSKSAPLPRLIR